MDYSKMSDKEINKLVAFALGCKEVVPDIFMSDDRRYEFDKAKTKSGNKFYFGPCSEITNAWPIMIDNNIGLEKEFSFCCSECSEYYDTGLWEASTPDAEHHCVHKNPLRAAMIVFLMMQESK